MAPGTTVNLLLTHLVFVKKPEKELVLDFVGRVANRLDKYRIRLTVPDY